LLAIEKNGKVDKIITTNSIYEYDILETEMTLLKEINLFDF
jgi:hypothetical protein